MNENLIDLSHFPYLSKLLEMGMESLTLELSLPGTGEITADSTHVEIAEWYGLNPDQMEWLRTTADDLADYSKDMPGTVDVPGSPEEALRILGDLFHWAADLESEPEPTT